MMNINKRLSHLRTKANEFCNIISEHAKSDSVIESIDKWLVKLTIDFLSTSMVRVMIQIKHMYKVYTFLCVIYD